MPVTLISRAASPDSAVVRHGSPAQNKATEDQRVDASSKRDVTALKYGAPAVLNR